MDEEQRERERLIPVLTRIRSTDHMKLIPRDVKRIGVPYYSYMMKLKDEVGEGEEFKSRIINAAFTSYDSVVHRRLGHSSGTGNSGIFSPG